MNTEAQFAPIAALDLEPIKVKLMHKESGEGWSLAYANAVEFEYRRFLYLMKKFPHEQAAPFFDVDVFWHYHILDTISYAADCQAVFGYFLHHFPYVGLRGAEDLKAHQRVGVRMRELYEQTYGEPYVRQEVGHSAANKIAFSIATTKLSSSTAATFAFSIATVAPAPLGAVDTAHCDASGPPAAAAFFSVRPDLSCAA